MAVLGGVAAGDRDRGVHWQAGGGNPGFCADAGGCAGQPDDRGLDRWGAAVYCWVVVGFSRFVLEAQAEIVLM